MRFTLPRSALLAVLAVGCGGQENPSSPPDVQSTSAALSSNLFKYPWSACVFDISGNYISAERYAQLGSPPVYTTNRITGDRIVAYGPDGSALFVAGKSFFNQSLGRYICWDHHLTPQEWTSMGSPQPFSISGYFYKCASNPTIYDYNGTYAIGQAVSFGQWQAWGMPAPAVDPGC